LVILATIWALGGCASVVNFALIGATTMRGRNSYVVSHGVRVVSVILIALSLAGCHSYAWVKASPNAPDFAITDFECDRDATLMSGGDVVAKVMNQSRCMYAHGWKQIEVAPGSHPEHPY
jgi:hypothetical protein